ncbi:MAG: DNA repair exonuclease [Clostridia bacterium]|nr:DNA repair exonuclease [Clostridia bacterium]
MDTVKLLHTGDIHLDSPFSGLSPRNAEIRRNELRASFTSMMNYAKMNSADMILIAGDVFDGEYITGETLNLLQSEFENFSKPVFITPGNHDCASSTSIWQKNIFPKNVHVFRTGILSSVKTDSPEVCVYGYAFTGREMTEVPFRNLTVDDPGKINILVGHCDMVSPRQSNNCCPVTQDDLENFGADYSALGHIHNPPEPGPDGKWCYCGCLEPRGFDERGPKGACMVEIQKENGISQVTVKRIRLSNRRYETGVLPVEGASTMNDVRNMILDFISASKYSEDTLLSLDLTGTVSPALVIDTEMLESAEYPVFCLRVRDLTHPDIDEKALESDIGIKGEVYRLLSEKLNSKDPREKEIATRALRYAVRALEDETM